MDDRLKINPSEPPFLSRAMAYCARAEQCEQAVRQKLAAWGAVPSEADAVVARLVDLGYLDAHRYARLFCESKLVGQRWGRRKVTAALRQKGLPPDAIEAALAAVPDGTEADALASLAAARARSLDLDQPADRARLMRYLAGRGFAPPDIVQAIASLRNRPDDDPCDDD